MGCEKEMPCTSSRGGSLHRKSEQLPASEPQERNQDRQPCEKLGVGHKPNEFTTRLGYWPEKKEK